MTDTRKCAVAGCKNLCKVPNIYCGWCAGYSHEMTPQERKQFRNKADQLRAEQLEHSRLASLERASGCYDE
jgi:hypothetical protein